MSALPKDSDEQEVFEIQDYTTASDWERFTASIEEILRDWQLTVSDRRHPPSNIDIRTAKIEWQERSSIIKFSDYSFNITHHFMTYDFDDQQQQNNVNNDETEEQLPQYLTDLTNLNNDFPGKAHCIVRWYGLREFVTLSPSNSSEPITSPSKAKLVLSSLAIAANNTSCQVPLFVQVNDISEKNYTGVGFGNDLRTDFEMAHIKSPPPQCSHLSGLLDIFKSKTGSSMFSDPVLVSVRFTYIISDWPHTLWSQHPPDFNATLCDVGFSELGRLPFGALSDPVSELQVSTTWPVIGEFSLLDTDYQGSLDPSTAPIWSSRLGSSNSPPCLLSEYLSEFLQICEKDLSIVQILGHDFDPTIVDGSDIISALDRLTGASMPSLSSLSTRNNFKSSGRDRGPIGEEQLSLILNFLFPDAQSLQEESAPYYVEDFSHIPTWNPPVTGISDDHPLNAVLRKMKSCPVDSFVWRLSVVLCHVIHSLGGLSSVAHLLYEVLLELRFRWDNAILIPGLSFGSPDMATCITNQKLQMLNCCISHRIAREENSSAGLNETLEDEEEFFECDESAEDQDSESVKEYSSWDKPEGRLKRFGNDRLLHRNDYLYVPITQEAAPNTEDMLEEQTGELLRLGSDSSGSCQRAKLMSSSLLSDMESFKAANPGSVLADFVRWYSPRDWIDEEQTAEEEEGSVTGHLSSRMLLPGNLWKEVWENAKPVPARRQKRLFDDTREAEKVLCWFNNISPGNLCLELLPVVMHASLCRLAEEPVLYTLAAIKEDSLPRPLHDDTLAAQLELLAKRVTRLSRQPPSLPQYGSIYYHVDMIERCIAKAQSLRLKLLGHTNVSPSSLIVRYTDGEEVSPREDKSMEVIEEETVDSSSILENLVSNLLNQAEVTLQGGSNGIEATVIKKLFSEALNALFEETPTEEKQESLRFDPPKIEPKHELGNPAGREYLLRTRAAFPTEHSTVLPQRLYAVIVKNDFRMAGAITQDTLFC